MRSLWLLFLRGVKDVYRAQIALCNDMFEVDCSDSPYTGNEITKEIRSSKLQEGVDYEVSYSDNVSAGTASISICGIGRAVGTLHYEFNITKKSPTFDAPAPLDATYGQKLADLMLPEGSYSVGYRDNVSAGEAAAVVSGEGFYRGSCELKFAIAKAKPDCDSPAPVEAAYGQTLSDVALPKGFSWQAGNYIALPGHWATGSGGWWYPYDNGGYPVNEWCIIDGSYYHFDGSGYMQTGWLNLGGTWYYLSGSGIMQTGWQKIDDS